MKLIVLLGFVGFVGIVIGKIVYLLSKKNRNITIASVSAVTVFLVVVFGTLIYKSATAPDNYCTTFHNTTSYPPATLKTAMDFFEQGNYDYDLGNCKAAIDDYTKSIKLNANYAQAYNNRAYTNMRLGNYKDALTDLDKALALNPNYINALMNRGDIHNYYIVDRKAAIADYEKVIALGGKNGTAVCGHLFLARHNGWTLATFVGFPLEVIQCNKGAL